MHLHWFLGRGVRIITVLGCFSVAAAILLDAQHFNEANDHVAVIQRREDHRCSEDRPCVNSACCGDSGFCGYGPKYCGKGCISNCDAVAECGAYANPPGKTCPLNVCCSQYGFCGTTEEFCTTKCQSNCVLYPSPPNGTGPGVLSKVIGYYESWYANSNCHKFKPSDLPLSILTHVNFAFAYIDPSNLELVPMDPDMSTSLFQEVTSIKSLQNGLKVYVSVGGWAFSNNGTVTQPLFGDVAADVNKRQQFANNVVRFMTLYGFDGVDLDWEYPGAPDRGGQVRDTQNYVLLLQALRDAFDAEGQNFGLTFTAPSSYWYLRWFDLPNMLQYADWINFMTYDLHGVWDATSQIGAVVQGHTNLTEIKLAAELLWRVNVPPEKVSMGFGFYGRSFTLSSSYCTTPGCPFSGAGTAGPCSDIAGILYSYEILALLRENPRLQPVHDQEAAVMYLTYSESGALTSQSGGSAAAVGGLQWISYDNHLTYQQKVEWANSVGLGGALIWASDADDDKYTEHLALTGEQAGHADLSLGPFRSDPLSIAQQFYGQNGQNCYISQYCTDQSNLIASSCEAREVKIGWEKGVCEDGWGLSICCPPSEAPTSCIWRGSSGNCNGQCHASEVKLFGSPWGGFPSESDMSKCSRGYKAFCCQALDWTQLMHGCSWTREICTTSETCATSLRLPIGEIWNFCCQNPTWFYDCRWRGTLPDCVGAKCRPDEVAVARSPLGLDQDACPWGQVRVACCKVTAPPPTHHQCPLSTLDLNATQCNTTVVVGRSRTYYTNESGVEIEWRLPVYPDVDDLFKGERAQIIPHLLFQQESIECDEVAVVGRSVDTANVSRRPACAVDHALNAEILIDFGSTLATGKLPSGSYVGIPPLPKAYLNGAFQQNSLPGGLPPVGPGLGALSPICPVDRLTQPFGWTGNPVPLLLTTPSISRMKAAKYQGTDADVRERLINRMFAGTRDAMQVFQYLNVPEVQQTIQYVYSLVCEEASLIEDLQLDAQGLKHMWERYLPDLLSVVQDCAQRDVTHALDIMEQTWIAEGANHSALLSVVADIGRLRSQIPNMLCPILARPVLAQLSRPSITTTLSGVMQGMTSSSHALASQPLITTTLSAVPPSPTNSSIGQI